MKRGRKIKVVISASATPSCPLQHTTLQSVSHWGLFRADLTGFKSATIEGRDARNRRTKEKVEMGVYELSSLNSADFNDIIDRKQFTVITNVIAGGIRL